MNEDKMIELQMQLKQNQAEMIEFVNDLGTWNASMKEKEELLKTDKPADAQGLPPVRNTLTKKRKKKKLNTESQRKESDAPKKIRSYDYKAWDKFDVEKACADVDGGKNKSSSEYETDEEAENLRNKQLANDHKEQGNSFFKANKFDEAIVSYTRAINLDPESAILVGNRAMALLKQQKYDSAEVDCTTAISLDPTYVKAYARRGTARMAMKKYLQAEEDFKQLLKLEPSNKQARTELNTIHQLLNPIPELTASLEICDKGIVSAVYKKPGERSKKPLKRILIQEIGVDESNQTKMFREKLKTSKTNPIVEKDLSRFDKFLSESSTVVPEKKSLVVSMENGGGRGDGSDIITYSNGKSLLTSGKQDKKVDNEMEIDDLPSTSEGHRSLVCSADTISKVLPTPQNSFQFQADWKMLKCKPDEFYCYLKQINPKGYPRIFGEALDADMLSKIFNTLHKYYLKDKEEIYPVLQHLTSVKRFNTMAMFLSNSDKQVLKELFVSLRSDTRYTDQQIDSLAKSYEL